MTSSGKIFFCPCLLLALKHTPHGFQGNVRVDIGYVIWKLCKECGVDSIGLKSDLLERLSSEKTSRQTYDKVFKKIWSASGEKQMLVF